MASRSKTMELAAFAAIGMAAGLCGLGALSLIYQDYALRVGAGPGVPGRAARALGALVGA